MKKSFCLIITFISVCNIFAQGQHVAAHLGDGISLETQLLNYNKIEELIITGTPTVEDYNYINQELVEKTTSYSIILNLKNTSIDTIPPKALYSQILRFNKIILPITLMYISDSAFCKVSQIEITDRFPELSTNFIVLDDIWGRTGMSFSVSKDNTSCVEIGGGIYSKNKEIFYTPVKSEQLEIEILEGTKIISGYAFAGCEIYDLIIPESVDSIGDAALAIIEPAQFTCCGSTLYSNIVCKSSIPPLLGTKPLFDSYHYDYCFLYVPDENVELYKNTDGWKDIPLNKRPISEYKNNNYSNVINITSNNIKVEYDGKAFVCRLAEGIKMQIYDTFGKIIDEATFINGVARVETKVRRGIYIYQIEHNGIYTSSKILIDIPLN